MSTQNYIVCSELHSRDCPKCCILSLCLQITFMFGDHIASKFAQIFTLKTEVRRLLCCCQVTLSIITLTQNKTSYLISAIIIIIILVIISFQGWFSLVVWALWRSSSQFQHCQGAQLHWNWGWYRKLGYCRHHYHPTHCFVGRLCCKLNSSCNNNIIRIVAITLYTWSHWPWVSVYIIIIIMIVVITF